MSLGKPDEQKDIIYFQEQWAYSAPALQTAAAERQPGTLLLVVEADTLETRSAAAALADEYTVVTVRLGASLSQETERCYSVNRREQADYTALLSDVTKTFPQIACVAMLWNQGQTIETAAGNAAYAIDSMFYWIKAFHALKLRLNNRWLSVSMNGDGERLDVEALGACGKSLERVYPRLRYTQVEVRDAGYALADILRGEIRCLSYPFTHEVRYEQGLRREKRLGEITLQDRAGLLKNKGIYLITGGAGSLGMILAGHLARTYRSRLILLGRSTPDSALELKLETLRGYGAQAEYIVCDIADRSSVKQAIQQAKRQFGAINGVIHAAGKASEQLIFQKEAHEFTSVLQPKTDGVLALDEALKEEPLDFFTVFSSTSSLIGDFGQGDYAVANRFLDRFCEYREGLAKQGMRSGKSISIQWPLWEAGGMHLENGAEKLYLQASGIGQLTAEQGIGCFEAVMADGRGQTAVIYGERSKLAPQLNLIKPNGQSQAKGGITKLDKHYRPEEMGQQHGVLLEEQVKHDVLRLAAEVLQTQTGKLDMDENMGDFGFDSISLKEYADGLSELYDVELSPAVFFAKTTLNELAHFLAEEDFSTEVAAYYAGKSGAVPEGPAVVSQWDAASLEEPSAQPNSTLSSGPPAAPMSPFEGQSIFTDSPAPAPALQPLSSKYLGRKKAGGQPAAEKEARDVAVVGLSFKLPGADTAEELWRFLDGRENQVREIPADRWDWKAYYSTDPQEDNKTNSRWGGFIGGHDQFDAKFFQISPREAELMDPQQRLFIQAAWRAVEDSGYKMSQLSGRQVGVFAGVQFSDYQQLLSANMDKVHAQSSIGNATALLSNRVSYLFNFKGPSESIDTACSSSLVALHRAVKSIQHHESELALAGGVSLMLDPNTYVGAGVMGVFSPEGRCKTFDRSANGYVKGEGVGVVVLKPLEKAVEDGDHIYGVIKGTAVNHGGRAHSLTAPNPDAQAELLLKAYTEAGIDPGTVSYIETHGTGTELGDPVEISGLKKAFAELYRRWNRTPGSGQPIGLGALKSNIGHLEPASGIAGFIKVLIALSKKQLPGNVHFRELNPYIQLEGSPFYVLEDSREWGAPQAESGKVQPRCAGVSSFGFGGTNAHVVIQEYMEKPAVRFAGAYGQPALFILSARNSGRLREYAARFMRYLDSETPDHLHSIAYTLQTGREEMEERLAAVACSIDELRHQLTAFCDARQTDGLFTGNAKKPGAAPGAKSAAASDVARALSSNDASTLAGAWTAGASIDWLELYGGQRPHKRAGLPTYPFAETSYWMPLKEAELPAPAAARVEEDSLPRLHALVNRNVSTLYEQAFETVFQGSEFYLSDHGHVLPGVVYLEMLRAAGELADPGRRVTAIRNVVWSNPVIVERESKTVRTVLQADAQGIDFRISSEQDGQLSNHAQGRLELSGAEKRTLEQYDIEALLARCSGGETEARSYYGLLGHLGAELGSRFQGIRALHCNQEEAITRLGVPESLNQTLDQFLLHPTLTDGGLQSAVAFAYQTGRIDRNVLYVPFVLGQLELFDASIRPAFAYVKQSASRGLKFDILFLSTAGEVIASMQELSIRPFQAGALQGAPSPETSAVYFKTEWTRAALQPSLIARDKEERLLLINAGLEETRQLAGTAPGQAVRIEWGGHFKKIDAGHYRINPSLAGDFGRLAAECGLTEETRLRIVCRLGNDGEGGLKERIEREIYPVFQLCKWLSAYRFRHEVRLCCFYQKEETAAEYSALAGFFRSLALEHPKLLGSVIHCTGDTPLAFILMDELAGSDGTPEVKYEDGMRFVRQLVPMQPVSPQEPKLARGGAYMIVGGMGGLGFIFAKYLASACQAKLVLCGRSPNADGAKLDELKALGAEVTYIQMDLASPVSAAQAVRTAKAAYGRLNGVFHCAGVVRDSLWGKKELTEIEEVLNPKVYGTVHLYEALAMEDLELFVPFSSSTSLIGNIGQGDYAYANSFLDHYVALMNGRLGRSDTVLNWSIWQNGGMQIDSATGELLWNKFGMRPMSDSEGIQAFGYSLALNEPQVMAAAGDRDKLIGAFTRSSRRESIRSAEKQPAPAASGQAQVPQLADALIGIMAGILKSDRSEISRDSDLAELGFDSISFTELSNAINRAFSVEITPTLFFEQSTPEAIAEAVYEEYGAAIDRHFQAAEPLLTRNTAGQAPAPDRGGADHVPQMEKAITQHAFRTLLPAPDVRTGVPEISGAARSGNGAASGALLSISPQSREPIAIIGMSGMMPGADNLDQFWSNLEAKRDMVTEIPADRWNWQDRFGDPRSGTGRTDVKYGAFVNGIDTFDPLFFGISPMEAEKMDPQERHMLQTVWHTLENAGYTADALAGTRTSVFIGVSNGDYQELLLKEDIATTLTRTMLSNRISYFFNWSGPSEPVDTACSSSLVAIHRAAESIWHDNCIYAVAGGINLIASPNLFIAGSSLGMLSKDGKCKTFDKNADGYVRGEGAAALLLKPLSAAIRDKDYIHGVIRGTAVNHGGKSNSITSPNAKAQADVIVQAHERAGIDPSTVTYIETHGTGTSLGDPIEVEGIKKAFKTLYRAWDKPESELPECVLGSVKTNIGHLESAAGMSSICKVLLSMKHKKVPGNLHFNEPNPYLKLEGTGLRIAGETAAWEALSDARGREIPRRAGVSSFGVGGSNAHIILEEYRNDPVVMPASSRSQSLIVLSAKSRSSLLENSRRLQAFVARNLAKASTASNDQAVPTLETAVRKDVVSLFAAVMGLAPEDIDADAVLEEYGLDAVKNVRLLEGLKEKYHLEFKDSLYGFSSLNSLVMFLLQHDSEAVTAYYAGSGAGGETRASGSAAPVSLEQLACGLQTGRTEFSERAAFVTDSLEKLHELLGAYISGNKELPGIYEGQSSTRSPLGKLFDGEESRLFINGLMQSSKLDKIAQLWVQGVAVDWPFWYKDAIRKTPLPEYAFDQERYWLPGPDRVPGGTMPEKRPEEGAEEPEALNDEQLLMWLNKVHKGEISAENLNMLVGDLLE